MTFEECIQSIHEGSVIDFQEYYMDRHEKKHLSLEILGAMVQRVFAADEELSRETLEQYYGTELSDQDYLQLSRMNCPRIVVALGVKEDNTMDIKILTVIKDFYKTELQKITVTNEVDPMNLMAEPNYLLSQQRGW